ncbi:MAG: exopolyphosphatase [SAR324 cluster bacterium]|nr:exopolyphosphatase [SAR324 cluster bacterium]
MKLLTRSDFDGLVCAVLLVEQGVVDDYTFVHPKDVQDGKIQATENDVLANIPYIPGCGLWFDHHSSEEERLKTGKLSFEGAAKVAPSAAQVIWDYYGGTNTFDKRLLELLEAVNKTDSGNLTKEDILNPEGWIILSFIMDPRTGLGRFKDYRISNHQLMMDMIQYCRTMTAEEVIENYDIQERIMRYFDQQDFFSGMLKRSSEVKGNLIVTNLKAETTVHSGNRFMVYALYPEQNIDVRVMWGRDNQNVVFACGHSILNRTSKTNVGKLMLKYGGGGHHMAGTCQVPVEKWEAILKEIVTQINADG